MLFGKVSISHPHALAVPQPSVKGLVVDLAGHGCGEIAHLGPRLNEPPSQVVVLIAVADEGFVESTGSAQKPPRHGSVPEMAIVEAEVVARSREAFFHLAAPDFDALLQKGMSQSFGQG